MNEENYLQISQVGIEFPTDGEPFLSATNVQLKLPQIVSQLIGIQVGVNLRYSILLLVFMRQPRVPLF